MIFKITKTAIIVLFKKTFLLTVWSPHPLCVLPKISIFRENFSKTHKKSFLRPVKPLYVFNNSYQNQFFFLFAFPKKLPAQQSERSFKKIKNIPQKIIFCECKFARFFYLCMRRIILLFFQWKKKCYSKDIIIVRMILLW